MTICEPCQKSQHQDCTGGTCQCGTGSFAMNYNPADHFAGRPGHWTMRKSYPHTCIHCGADYNCHNPWPQLPCPVMRFTGFDSVAA